MSEGKQGSDILRRNADRAHKAARLKIHKAMKAMEADIEGSDGLYPYNKGRVTTSEVLRRAGVSAALMQGTAHKNTTRFEVSEFLARITARMIAGHKRVRRAVTDRADEWKTLYQELQSGWAVAELEYVARQQQVADLQGQVAALQKQLAEARMEAVAPRGASGKVVHSSRDDQSSCRAMPR